MDGFKNGIFHIQLDWKIDISQLDILDTISTANNILSHLNVKNPNLISISLKLYSLFLLNSNW